MFRKSVVVAACGVTLFTGLEVNAATTAPGDTDMSDVLETVSVIGRGESRQVQRITSKNLDVLPPGTSPQKALNILPGVNAQSIDALATNEQSMTLSLRGFNATRLGYTLDGMPLGDSAYNNYNGLSIGRALISENLQVVELAEGIGSISTPSTSNLGGAIAYVSSDPAKTMGGQVSQSFGSDSNRRTFMRFDSGDYNGFSMYLSGMYGTSDLWNDQQAYNESTNKQFNGKAVYEFDSGRITAFVDTSRTSQADDFYLSKNELTRGLGWDWGGYAPDFNKALSRAYCNTGSFNAARCDSSGPDKDADGAFTGGQILRNDELYYLTGEFNVSDSVNVRAQAYHHEDKGDGNNWNSGSWSNFGTAQQLPLIIRSTLYTIDRTGGMLSVGWDLGINHIEGGGWYEHNVSSASRYNYTTVTGPRDLGTFLSAQPDVGVFDQRTVWETHQAYLKDTIKLLDDRLSIDAGFKTMHSTADARALPGVAKTPIAPNSSAQFATGSLEASKDFLPQAGVRYKLTDDQEVFASYAQNIAMFQGGFKLGPQAVSQSVWDSQGELEPEESRSVEAGYRIVRPTYQGSAAVYYVHFDNRLLQYNPCDSRQPVGPTCGNRFYNVGGVNSKGLELTFLWTPSSHFSWFNSASFNRSTYSDDYVQGGVVVPTSGKTQVDTPDTLFASEATYSYGQWYATLRGKYTGKRYYTYTNDQGFGGFTTLDFGTGYDFGELGFVKDARLSLNVTNLTDKRYAANLDNSVFAPSDPNGTIYVFHASAPLQAFGSIVLRF
ncbi:MAG TPA: TonB-dependent receptor [Steroidobacteraceae bacterium]